MVVLDSGDALTMMDLDKHERRHCAVNRLPHELIARVFLDLTAVDIHGAPRAQVPCETRASAFTVAAVCHTWRTIALNTSRIWTALPGPTPWKTSVMIQRCGNSPLHVDMCSGWEKFFEPLDSLALVFNYFDHIESVDIVLNLDVAGTTQFYQLWSNVVSRKASRLKRVCLTQDQLDFVMLAALDGPHERASNVYYPLLESLELQNISLPFVPQSFPALRKLKLYNGMTFVTFPLLLQVLSHLTMLEELSFTDIVAHIHEQDVDPSLQPITLPRVQSLTIKDSERGMMNLLMRYIIPQSPLRLLSLWYPCNDGDFRHDTLLQWPAVHMHMRHLSRLDCSWTCHIQGDTLFLGSHFTKMIVEGVTSDGNKYFFNVCSLQGSEYIETMLGLAFDTMATLRLPVLGIDAAGEDINFGHDFWTNGFMKVGSCLRELTLTECTFPRDLFSALHTPTSSMMNTASAVLVPYMDVLNLKAVLVTDEDRRCVQCVANRRSQREGSVAIIEVSACQDANTFHPLQEQTVDCECCIRDYRWKMKPSH